MRKINCLKIEQIIQTFNQIIAGPVQAAKTSDTDQACTPTK